MNLLSFNAGSSSIKCALYDSTDAFKRLFFISVQHCGTPNATITLQSGTNVPHTLPLPEAHTYGAAISALLNEVTHARGNTVIDALSHRIVFGATFDTHTKITKDVIDTLTDMIPLDPDHLPQQLELIHACTLEYPQLPQVACFDTVFHRTLPRCAQLLPIPRVFRDLGATRHGFHGLSYTYIASTLKELTGESYHMRVIAAHLGSGSSVAALSDGVSIETSMGFSPSGGIPMSTRSGDLDPGVFRLMTEYHKNDIEKVYSVLNTQSGLLGISETTADMRVLLEQQASDSRAADAVSLFCYNVQKCIGSYTAVLNGLDTLVFSGGIGEASAEIRSRICSKLSYLGIALDPALNTENAICISSDTSRVKVFVIPTQEELVMARIALAILST